MSIVGVRTLIPKGLTLEAVEIAAATIGGVTVLRLPHWRPLHKRSGARK